MVQLYLSLLSQGIEHVFSYMSVALMRGNIIAWLLVITASVSMGFQLNLNGIIGWDDDIQYFISRAAIGEYGLSDKTLGQDHNGYYAVLWESILGLLTEYIFPSLRDPFLVRHAFTFALFPLTLVLTYTLLLHCKVGKANAFLCVSCLFGMIRFGGHALFNVKDAPASCVFLVSTLALWLLFCSILKSGTTLLKMSMLGFMAALPFLVRVPLLLHIALLLSAISISLFHQKMNMKNRFMFFVTPLLSCSLTLVAFYPKFWTLDTAQLAKPFNIFNDFAAVGIVRAWGTIFETANLPAWYSLAWFPTIMNPIAFFVCCVGLFSLLIKSKTLPKSFSVSIGSLQINLSLIQWLWIVVSLSFAAVMIMNPSIYDEERQILFLYPPLVLLCVLGFHNWHASVQIFLGIAVLIFSSFSYTSWGRYSYVYKSPLVINRSSNAFLGDYWGTCFAKAVTVLPDVLPENVKTVHSSLNHVSILQARRLTNSVLYANVSFPTYEWVTQPVPEKYAHIEFNRFKNVMERFNDSRHPTLLWSDTLPPGETACAIFLYPPIRQE